MPSWYVMLRNTWWLSQNTTPHILGSDNRCSSLGHSIASKTNQMSESQVEYSRRLARERQQQYRTRQSARDPVLSEISTHRFCNYFECENFRVF